eukprot:1138530-Pelagomonas_calceolata.AAC.1
MSATAAGSDDDDVSGSSRLPRSAIESVHGVSPPGSDDDGDDDLIVSWSSSQLPSQSSAAEVHAFYSEWSHFCTAKSFGWADQYNLASAPNRPFFFVLAQPKYQYYEGKSPFMRSAILILCPPTKPACGLAA